MDVQPSRLRIRLLGAPEVQIGGTGLPLNHLKSQALLFFLAATGQSHSRDYLATLLWSEAGPNNAHHSLRTSIYRLRQALRPEQADLLLASEGEMLSLRPDQYECDVIEFRRALAEGDQAGLARAVGLYRGPLLQGFTLADAPGFEEWARLEESRLSQACLEGLERLTAWAEARQDGSAAIDYLQQMIQIDPLAETAQQRLIRAYLQQGEVGLALRQYRLFENQMRQELGLAPAPETQALLYDALRRQRGPGKLLPSPAGGGTLSAYTLPFIGRDPLLRQLQDVAREVQAGHGMTVLLEGEGGIGKSRLLEELSAHLIAASPPWMVLQGACTPFDDLLSHGPFLEALQNGAPDNLTDLRIEPDSGAPDARERFSWTVLQTIRSLTHSVPLLLVIEDLQWASSSTLNLFGLLSMRLHHLPVLLAGTVQHAEAIPALQRLISLGRRRGELHLLALTPLSVDSVSEMLSAARVKAPAVETLAEWLHARSGGSPFLLAEILAQLRAEAILVPDDEGWQLDIPRWLRWRTAFSLPETTHDLVAWRLANLPPKARYLLDVLAVAGQPLAAAILRGFSGLPESDFLRLVDDLAARGLIVEAPGAGLALPHHLLRETLLHRLSSLRRRTIYQQLAQALEAQPPAVADDTLKRQIALYAVAGEDILRARTYGLRVLKDLPQEYTGAETVDFVNHLYDLLQPDASPAEMVLLARAAGTLHQALGHLVLAADWHQKTLAWAHKAGDTRAQASAHFEMSECALMANDYQSAARAAEEGLSIIAKMDSPPQNEPASFDALAGRGQRLLGAALAMEGSDLSAAEQHLQEAAGAQRRAGSPVDLCAALFELGNTAAQRGELQRALDFYDESARAAQAGRVHYYLALARNNFAYHSLLLGRVGAAQQAVLAGIKVAETYDLLAALLHLYSTQGEIQLYLGEWKAAEESFHSGLTLAEDLGSLERQAGYRGGLALAARGRGDLDAAASLFMEALELIAEQGYWHLRTRLQLGLAEIALEQKHLPEAAQPLEAAIATARQQRRTLLLVQGQGLCARLLAANGDGSAANDLFTETLRMAEGLGLPLEIARVQAAWGEAGLRYSLAPAQSQTLIAAARSILAAHDARAELAALEKIQAAKIA